MKLNKKKLIILGSGIFLAVIILIVLGVVPLPIKCHVLINPDVVGCAPFYHPAFWGYSEPIQWCAINSINCPIR